MSLQDYYEESFRLNQTRTEEELLQETLLHSRGLFQFAQESKERFLTKKDWKDVRALEMGSGHGGAGIHLAKLGSEVALVDFSPTAIEGAKRLFATEGLRVKTFVGDVTFPDLSFEGQYDLILDSHLLHCLTSDPDRSSYYKLIHDHLTQDGIFVAETMVHRKKLFIPDGFMFDETNTLWQMFGQWTPVRRILDSLDLEQELLNAGFKISYFYYYGQYSVVPHKSFLEIPNEVLPAAVRFVIQRK